LGVFGLIENNMTYTAASHINSVQDVEVFFHHLVDERKVNFHPDDDFANYICLADKTPSFSAEEVTVYNHLMDESFDVCDKADVDIYDIGFNELTKDMNMT
jgi:hypothetical protein